MSFNSSYGAIRGTKLTRSVALRPGFLILRSSRPTLRQVGPVDALITLPLGQLLAGKNAATLSRGTCWTWTPSFAKTILEITVNVERTRTLPGAIVLTRQLAIKALN